MAEENSYRHISRLQAWVQVCEIRRLSQPIYRYMDQAKKFDEPLGYMDAHSYTQLCGGSTLLKSTTAKTL